MINIPHWKRYFVLGIALLAFLYASPNVMPQSARDMMQSWPSWLPSKTVNLGLDLRGGAHLLYDVDVDVVYEERIDALVSDARRSMRDDKISGRVRALSGSQGMGIEITGLVPGSDEQIRRMLRQANPNMLIETSSDKSQITAELNDVALSEILDQTIDQSIEIVRRRVDELGTTEPSIQRQGDKRILLQVPGANASDLKRIVGKTAKLSFHLVKEPGSAGASRTLPMAENPGQRQAINRRAMITGDMLENAQPSFDQGGQAVVSFRLNGSGARRFCDVSRENVGRPFAIVLDNEIISAPVIREAICGGSGQISGGFTVQSANDLALLLRAGALPAPLTVVEERSVGPSLGADSVEAGRIASIIALAAVLVFMVLSYRLFGLFADVALVVNVALIFALLSMLQATLTLPGIAGIVLTIGMAVDANVLIFERIKEEMRAGRSMISSIDAGYSRAMATIIDSNLTTLIAAIILFSFGTGPIKGFAVTLGIGIMTSFFSAIMVTRLMVVVWLKNMNPKQLPI